MSKTEFVWPSSAEDQKSLKAKIEEAKNLLIEKEVLDSDITTISEQAKDAFGISVSEFKAYVKASYDKEKFLEDLQKRQRISDDLGI